MVACSTPDVRLATVAGLETGAGSRAGAFFAGVATGAGGGAGAFSAAVATGVGDGSGAFSGALTTGAGGGAVLGAATGLVAPVWTGLAAGAVTLGFDRAAEAKKYHPPAAAAMAKTTPPTSSGIGRLPRALLTGFSGAICATFSGAGEAWCEIAAGRGIAS